MMVGSIFMSDLFVPLDQVGCTQRKQSRNEADARKCSIFVRGYRITTGRWGRRSQVAELSAGGQFPVTAYSRTWVRYQGIPPPESHCQTLPGFPLLIRTAPNWITSVQLAPRPESSGFREYSPLFQRRRKCSDPQKTFAALRTPAPLYSDLSRCNPASIGRATPRRSAECQDQALR